MLLAGINSHAQQITKITGIVTDSTNGEPIPFVNIQLLGTNIGASTGFDGKYIIETKTISDSIVISYVGYKKQKRRIKIGSFQNLDIQLSPSNITLAAVTILPGENPAHILLRRVIANKKTNSNYILDTGTGS